jgi:uncharacterized protein (TIGR02001 family)
MRAIVYLWLCVLAIRPAFGEDASVAETADTSTFSGTITLTSDYRFRGQSQADRNAAVQGGIDYAHASGLYAGFWTSSIDFGDAAQTPAEVDFTAGYSHAVTETITASVAVAYYWYPDSGEANYDFLELLANAAFDLGDFTLTGDGTYSADYSGNTGEGIGLAVGIQVPLTIGDIDWLTMSGQFGRQWIEDNALYGMPDWYFYDAGLTATHDIFSFDVRYTGTNLSEIECFGGTELCAGGVVISLTAALPG